MPLRQNLKIGLFCRRSETLLDGRLALCSKSSTIWVMPQRARIAEESSFHLILCRRRDIPSYIRYIRLKGPSHVSSL